MDASANPTPNLPIRLDEEKIVKYADKECRTCHKVFTPKFPKQIYCRKNCRPVPPSTRVMKVCEICKTTFSARFNQLTCSPRCQRIRNKKKAIVIYRPVQLVSRVCLTCRKIFKGKRSTNYCSDNCKDIGYARRKKVKAVLRESLANDPPSESETGQSDPT